MLIDHIPVGIVSVCGGLLEKLYVLPTEQRKGYGAMLLHYVLKQCRGANAFYKKHGFVESGNKKKLPNDLFEVELILCNERNTY